MSQQQQQQKLVANAIIEQQQSSAFADIECPDCFAQLGVYYDEQKDNARRYYCENCGHQVNAGDIECDWDNYDGGGEPSPEADNDISIHFSRHSNRRLF